MPHLTSFMTKVSEGIFTTKQRRITGLQNKTNALTIPVFDLLTSNVSVDSVTRNTDNSIVIDIEGFSLNQCIGEVKERHEVLSESASFCRNQKESGTANADHDILTLFDHENATKVI